MNEIPPFPYFLFRIFETVLQSNTVNYRQVKVPLEKEVMSLVG